MSESPAGKYRPHKRKKKNSRFLRNAKGFAKQGIYGRGTTIEDDQYNYFINILDAMKNGFEDTEEKVNMAQNVFEQTIEQEIHLASNQVVCKALESLIGFVDAKSLERFFSAFVSNLRPICSDRFASHVLQKMVEIAFLRSMGRSSQILSAAEAETEANVAASKRTKMDLLNEEQYNLDTAFAAEHRAECHTFVGRISKFLLNNLEDFVWDTCANHIMRTCILSLAGVHVSKVAFERGGASMAKQRQLYEVPIEWVEIMQEFPQRLEMWPQFVDLPYSEHSSALLSVICIALKAVDKNKLKHFGKQILTQALLKAGSTTIDEKKIILDDASKDQKMDVSTDDELAKAKKYEIQPLPAVFESHTAVILLETLLTVAGPKLVTQLYAMLFVGRLALLAEQPLTNFAVQKLLQNIKEVIDFESVFGELVSHMETLLRVGHTGVVESLVAACLRLSTKQAQMMAAMQTALHVVAAGDKEKAKKFFHCLVKLKPSEILCDDTSNFVHLHGSLIAQHLLRFNKPIFLVTGILDTPADQLLGIFNTPNGSHIADAFLLSNFIGEKSRERLLRHLEGCYLDLAITKFGSRVVDRCFSVAAESQQLRIVKELAERSNQLKGSPFGGLLYSKYRIETYCLSATQWKVSLQQQKGKKAQQLFKDIVA